MAYFDILMPAYLNGFEESTRKENINKEQNIGWEVLQKEMENCLHTGN